MCSLGLRAEGDSRITLLRVESADYIFGRGRKVSLSLHPFLFRWQRQYRELRVTLLGINIHWRSR